MDVALAAIDEWLDARRMRVQLSAVGQIGIGCRLGRDVELISPECMSFGELIRIGSRSRIQAVRVYRGCSYAPTIRVGSRTSFENDCHVAAAGSVEIGNDVLVAGGVFISDHVHEHQDIGLPVVEQPLRVGSVIIGDGSHIGEHAAVFGSLTVGEHAVIGANAVVTSDVPAFTVVAGAPARVISRFSPDAGRWVRVG